jgi:hypothetical protein
MAANAVAAVGSGGVFGMAGNVSDVAFRTDARLQIKLRELRQGRQRERANRSSDK